MNFAHYIRSSLWNRVHFSLEKGKPEPEMISLLAEVVCTLVKLHLHCRSQGGAAPCARAHLLLSSSSRGDRVGLTTLSPPRRSIMEL